MQTEADKRLPSTDSVLTLLHWVEKHMMERKPRQTKTNHRGNSPSNSQVWKLTAFLALLLLGLAVRKGNGQIDTPPP